MEVLLRKNIIKEYDIAESRNRVDKIIEGYIKAKYVYSNIKNEGENYYDSSSTAKYEYRPEYASINYGDKVGNKACSKIDNEMEAERIKKDIELLYHKFTDMEKDFFDTVLLKTGTQKELEKKYHKTKIGMDPIKNSCILKTALHFNVAVMIDKLIDD